MRAWYKYLLIDAKEDALKDIDENFEDHIKTMNYAQEKGFSSKEDFYQTYYENHHERYKTYQQMLTANISLEEEVLFLGSGRCVNEAVLKEQGYRVTCSDLNVLKPVQTLFPELSYVSYDVTKGVYPEKKVDVIVALSVFFLFDQNRLREVIQNMKGSLTPGGTIIFDMGGAEDNVWTRFFDWIVQGFEMFIKMIYVNLLRAQRMKLIKKQHGFRYKDKEIINLFAQEGFTLKDIDRSDYTTELERSLVLGRLSRSIMVVRKFLSRIGRVSPYVRIFVFQREHS